MAGGVKGLNFGNETDNCCYSAAPSSLLCPESLIANSKNFHNQSPNPRKKGLCLIVPD